MLTRSLRPLAALACVVLALLAGGACSDTPTGSPDVPEVSRSLTDSIGGESSTNGDPVETCVEEGLVRMTATGPQVCRGGQWGSGN